MVQAYFNAPLFYNYRPTSGYYYIMSFYKPAVHVIGLEHKQLTHNIIFCVKNIGHENSPQSGAKVSESPRAAAVRARMRRLLSRYTCIVVIAYNYNYKPLINISLS